MLYQSFLDVLLCVIFLLPQQVLSQNQPAGDAIVAQTSQPSSSLQKVACQAASLYQNPNASASYNIPAVDTIKGTATDGKYNVTFKQSSSVKWKFTNVLGQSTDAYAPDNHTVLQQAMFLDTSTSSDVETAALDAGLTGCSFFFSLPMSKLGIKDDGSCHSVFDQKCVDDFTSQANAAALRTSQNTSSAALTWTESCKSIADAMSSVPPSCIKFKEKSSRSLGNGIRAYSPLDLRPPFSRSAYNCNNTAYSLDDKPVPANLFLQSAAWPNKTDFKLYDQWASTVTPVLLTYYTNSSKPGVQADRFSQSQLICSSPSTVQAGSRIAPKPQPSNAADSTSGQTDLARIVIVALVINAAFFVMF